MDDIELRLKCLTWVYVKREGWAAEAVIAEAEKIFQYVLNCVTKPITAIPAPKSTGPAPKPTI